jgi:hypothetical protein
LKAKGEGFDMDCAKFWSGRLSGLDREKYDKFYQDIEFVRNQYVIAEKHLDIVSGSEAATMTVEQLTERIVQPDFIKGLVTNETFIKTLRNALNGS